MRRPGVIVGIAVAILAVTLWLLTQPVPSHELTLTQLTFDPGLTTWPAISADGKTIAYASDRDDARHLYIYVQRIPGGTPTRLTSTDDDETEPAFSPDGATLAYHSSKDGGGIYTIALTLGDHRLASALDAVYDFQTSDADRESHSRDRSHLPAHAAVSQWDTHSPDQSHFQSAYADSDFAVADHSPHSPELRRPLAHGESHSTADIRYSHSPELRGRLTHDESHSTANLRDSYSPELHRPLAQGESPSTADIRDSYSPELRGRLEDDDSDFAVDDQAQQSPELRRQLAHADSESTVADHAPHSSEWRRPLAPGESHSTADIRKSYSPELPRQLAHADSESTVADHASHSPKLRRQLAQADPESPVADQAQQSPKLRRQLADAGSTSTADVRESYSPELRRPLAQGESHSTADIRNSYSPELRRPLTQADSESTVADHAPHSPELRRQLAHADSESTVADHAPHSPKLRRPLTHADSHSTKDIRNSYSPELRRPLTHDETHSTANLRDSYSPELHRPLAQGESHSTADIRDSYSPELRRPLAHGESQATVSGRRPLAPPDWHFAVASRESQISPAVLEPAGQSYFRPARAAVAGRGSQTPAAAIETHPRDPAGQSHLPLAGGEPHLLVRGGHAPRYSPDGRWIVYSNSAGASIISSSGGSPRRVHPEIQSLRAPAWSPDGRWLIFWSGGDMLVAPLDGGHAESTGLAERLTKAGIAAGPIEDANWTTDALLFSARTGYVRNLYRCPLDKHGKASGDIVRLTNGTEPVDEVAVSRDGSILFSASRQRFDIWGLPLDVKSGRASGLPYRITDSLAPTASPDISADGRKLLFSSSRNGFTQIWEKNLDTGQERVAATSPEGASYGRLLQHSGRILYVQPAAGHNDVYLGDRKLASGVRPWDADSKEETVLLSGAGIDTLNLKDGLRSTLISAPPHTTLSEASFSPAGKWILFLAESGPDAAQIYVAPAQGGEWRAITDSGGRVDKPRFSPDGRRIYFTRDRENGRAIEAIPFDSASGHPSGPSFAVFEAQSPSLSLAGVSPLAQELGVAHDKLVMILCQSMSTLWIARMLPY